MGLINKLVDLIYTKKDKPTEPAVVGDQVLKKEFVVVYASAHVSAPSLRQTKIVARDRREARLIASAYCHNQTGCSEWSYLIIED